MSKLVTFDEEINFRDYKYVNFLKRTSTLPLGLLLWMIIIRCTSVALSVASFSLKTLFIIFLEKLTKQFFNSMFFSIVQ